MAPCSVCKCSDFFFSGAGYNSIPRYFMHFLIPLWWKYFPINKLCTYPLVHSFKIPVSNIKPRFSSEEHKNLWKSCEESYKLEQTQQKKKQQYWFCHSHPPVLWKVQLPSQSKRKLLLCRSSYAVSGVYFITPLQYTVITLHINDLYF